MADTIGVSRIELVADSSGVESGVNKAKQSMQSLAQETERAANRQVQANTRTFNSLKRQAETLGLTREELIRYNIAQKASAEQAVILTGALDKQTAKLRQQAGVQREISEGQLRAARAQTPAQLQDFFIQIQGGQSPLTALLQQGSQLQGAYGSVGSAIKGVGASVASVINPITVSAAAVATLGVAAYQGATELEGLNLALIQSGNTAGLTGQALVNMAGQLDELKGVTTGGAVDALAQFAATGAFTGDQLKVASAAALQWQVATGTAIDETVKKFVALSDDPVKAILELDKQMNFLTESQIKAIQGLVEVGNQAGAADAAIRAFADTLAERSGRAVENTGAIEKAWKAVRSAVSEAWDAMKSVGRAGTSQEQIAQLNAYIKGQEELGRVSKLSADGEKERLANLARARADLQRVQTAFVTVVDPGDDPQIRKQREANAKLREENARAEESAARSSENLQTRLEAVRTDLHRKGVTDRAAIDKAVQLETDKFNQRKASGSARGSISDGGLGSAQLAAIKAQASQEKQAIADSTAALKEQYAAREVSANTYYASLRELSQQAMRVEVSSVQQQIDSLSKQTGARQKSGAIAVQIASLQEQAQALQAQGEAKLASITREEEAAAKKRADSLRAYREALEQTTQAMQQDFATAASRVGMGDRQYELESKLNDVLREKAKRLREIALQEQSGQLSAEDAGSNRSAVEDNARKQIEVIREGYRALDAEQADALNGVTAGLANYATESANVAGQIQSALGGALTGLEDAFVNLATTGKTSFKDLANSIISDLARIAAKQAVSGIVGSLLGGLSGGAGASAATGGFLAGPGFASGGYTGHGAVNQPAGVVHRGEVVWSQSDIARAGGVATVEAMRKGAQGYAAGGVVGGLSGSVMPSSPNVNVTVIGGEGNATAEASVGQDGSLDIKVFLAQVEKYIAGNMSAGRSPVMLAIKSRLNVEDRK
ncbi:tail length tape measure protein [Xanthomonas phage CP1]|uniref:Tail length tape measure protein n=1 Tax=Xanthomonas phage CP1 TaxID=2994055 RepID=I7HDJ2_9CAUD|nr:tail length tape measure protein [Xanthomonas phage CP1]BAM29090.1 putative tail length tape measure protein [Xanthomonas phage CP1]